MMKAACPTSIMLQENLSIFYFIYANIVNSKQTAETCVVELSMDTRMN